jgi:siderophore synthetase component
VVAPPPSHRLAFFAHWIACRCATVATMPSDDSRENDLRSVQELIEESKRLREQSAAVAQRMSELARKIDKLAESQRRIGHRNPKR